MSPLREYRSVEKRFENDSTIEVFRRYYLIFEGANTEVRYFQGIVDNRKALRISGQIELVILNKEEEIRNYSHPKKLLEIINEKKKTVIKDGKYDKKVDRFVIVFDRDSYKNRDEYINFIELAGTDNLLVVTSPCFELWLILHYENVIDNHIFPLKNKLLANEKVSNTHTYASKLFSEISGCNPKSGSFFNRIKDGIDLAVMQEKLLEQDNVKMATEIGSNVGILIEELREDPRSSFI